jgi:effector-binding domain-containing protein
MTMSELEVRIVRLAPMRVASAYGFGASPEEQAWRTLFAWTKPRQVLSGVEGGPPDGAPIPRFFGFNNPSPAPGSPNYGYEQWMTVGPDVEGGEGVTIKDFPGGLYAVTRCEGLQNIEAVWHRLATWGEEGAYRLAHHQWLEECLTPEADRLEDYVFDLYLPITG